MNTAKTKYCADTNDSTRLFIKATVFALGETKAQKGPLFCLWGQLSFVYEYFFMKHGTVEGLFSGNSSHTECQL